MSGSLLMLELGYAIRMLQRQPIRKPVVAEFGTTPNAVTSPVHDRMPLILDPDNHDLWLDPGMKDVTTASELLRRYDARLMRCYPISTRINHVDNDDEECSTPVELTEIQSRLFFVEGLASYAHSVARWCHSRRSGHTVG